MKKGLMEKEEMLARVKDEDSVIEEARTRMTASLRKANYTRTANRKIKELEKEDSDKRHMRKVLNVLQKNRVLSEKEDLQERITLANLSEQVEKIESDQAIAQSLSMQE
jgi:hypothetical protein